MTGRPTRTLYFDESGYTGYNLLDPAQTVFVIASSDVGDAEASDILREAFPRYQGDEFKFTNIWRSGARRGLLQFANRLPALSERTFLWMSDKPFVVLTKMVDFLIEPITTTAGYDFYSDGFAWKFSNYIHFGLKEFAPPELLATMLRDYMAFSRAPSEEALDLLAWKLRLMSRSLDPPVRLFLEQMADGAEAFLHFTDLETFRSSNELHTSTMIALVSHWRRRIDDDFAVVHDASSTFLRNRRMWENVTSEAIPEQPMRGGDGQDTPYPLRVVSTMAVDSRDSAAVQFCDVLAGLSARHFSTNDGAEREFLDEVVRAGLSELTWDGVRPALVFPDSIPPRRLDGPDAVDRMAEVIRHSEGRRASPGRQGPPGE